MSNTTTQDTVDAEIAELSRQLDEAAVAFPKTRMDGRGQQKPVGCVENTEALMHHYSVTCRYNEMTKSVELKVPTDLHPDKALNDAIVIMRDLARKQGYDASIAEENLGPISGKNSYHPVRDWITAVKWDGTDRVAQLLDTVTTAEDDDYKKMLIDKWLISAVALVMYDTPFENSDHQKHGFKGVEGILVFKGKQGLGKTQWIESLTPAKSMWAKDAVTLSPSDKDSVLLAVSHWIVELGEIDATFRKTDIAAIKGFATQKVDKLRPPYGKAQDSYARRTAFTGTVNDEKFLGESGETRRWWVLSVDAIDANHGIDIQQLWAQVYSMYMQCIPYWLSSDERAVLYRNNATYERVDPLVERLERYISQPLFDANDKREPKPYDEYGAARIAEIVLRKQATKVEADRTANWLSEQGFFRYKQSKKFRVKINFPLMQSDYDTDQYAKWGEKPQIRNF